MFPESYDVYELKVRMRIDRESARSPDRWDWYELLDLRGDEYAQVLSCEFIGRSDEIVDEYGPEYEPEGKV